MWWWKGWSELVLVFFVLVMLGENGFWRLCDEYRMGVCDVEFDYEMVGGVLCEWRCVV